MAISSYGVRLLWGTTMALADEVAHIKDYPDLGGPPNTLAATTLQDPMEVFVRGIKKTSTMEFTCNYTEDSFSTVLGTQRQTLYYILDFGGNNGAFYWQGQHVPYPTGAGVDAVSEYKILVVPSTEVKFRPNLATVTLGALTVDTTSSALTLVYSPATLPAAAVLTYRWLISNTQTGVYAPIVGATAATYKPVSGQGNKYIKVEVTAKSGAGGVIESNAVKVTP